MGALDIIIIVIIVLAAVYGAIKGFMHQIGTLTALVAGVLVCRFFGARVADAIVDAGAQYASAYRMMVYVLLFVLVSQAYALWQACAAHSSQRCTYVS